MAHSELSPACNVWFRSHISADVVGTSVGYTKEVLGKCGEIGMSSGKERSLKILSSAGGLLCVVKSKRII